MYNISYGRKYVYAVSEKTWTGKLEIFIYINDVILLLLLKYEKDRKEYAIIINNIFDNLYCFTITP